MIIFPFVFIGKVIAKLSQVLRLGSGGTWPGEVSLIFYPGIFWHFASQVKKAIVIVAGTNGKTTTTKMIRSIISSKNGESIVYNESGANLLNGLVSKFIDKSNIWGNIEVDYAVFEVDEAFFGTIYSQLKNYKGRTIILFMNLFRDQLDRYGEVDLIAAKWKKALNNNPEDLFLILNADDPQIAYLGKSKKYQKLFYGLRRKDNKEINKRNEYASDATHCPKCLARLRYSVRFYSHIGIWECKNCGLKRPKVNYKNWKTSLKGIYNKYNALAAGYTAKKLGFSDRRIRDSLVKFEPAFGRQESFFHKGKKVEIFLSKNPAGFNVSLRAVIQEKPEVVLLVLNDQIPDGKDVSWIWDVDFEMIPKDLKIVISGERVYDLALRLKYTLKECSTEAMKQLIIEPDLKKAIHEGLKFTSKKSSLYILPTYSAMLEVRKILIGRKIL